MTKFEELMNIIAGNKRKQNNNRNELDNYDNQLEVAGSESSKTSLLSCGDDDIDGSIIP
ncbi:MAG: hypothetical protein ACRD97_02540 [Nitrososphaeraceae archaeon]